MATIAVMTMMAREVAMAFLCSMPSAAVNAGTITIPPPTPQSAPRRPAVAPMMRAMRMCMAVWKWLEVCWLSGEERWWLGFCGVGLSTGRSMLRWGYEARRWVLVEVEMSSTMRRWRTMRWSRAVVTRFLSAWSDASRAFLSADMG